MTAAARRILALAGNGFRQAVRDKVLYVLAGFGAVLIVGSIVISHLTVGERARIVMNLGLSGTSLLGTLVAVFVTINQVAREIERRTIATILSKPVSRTELVLGRFAGMAATLAVLVGAMAALHAAVLTATGAYDPQAWKAAYLSWVGATFVAALTLCVSSFMTPLPGLFVSLAGVVIGHSSWGLAMLAQRLESPLSQWLLKVLYVALPNFGLLDVRDAVVQGVDVPWTTLAWATGYAAGYSAVLLVLASALLARRDIV